MMNLPGTLTLVAALLLAACTATEKKPDLPASEAPVPQSESSEAASAASNEEPAMIDETPQGNDDEALEAEGFENSYGELETFMATLKIDATVGSKAFQGVHLEVEDGRSFLVAYRPDERWRSFEDERVQVTGRPYTPGALTQHILAEHFEVQSIDKADLGAPSWTGDTETLEGQLVEEPMGPPGSKLADELTHWLLLDDGARLLIGGAGGALVGKRVKATGRRWKPSPYVSHIGALHFDADSVVEAEVK
ncbi:MAG: hypothetical protein RBU37_17145 [Myxococcota bacterium]|jgi:hypothetical protein|nr:hypothetical protein [Myxococcota bacterium]